MMRDTANRLPRRGLTLIEKLIVIAIIAILVGLLLPAVQKVRDAAARAACQNHLRQIGLAHHQFHQAQGRLPAGVGSFDNAEPRFEDAVLTWHMWLLPYIEQGALWEQIVQAYAIDPTFDRNPPHTGKTQQVVKLYLCAAESRTQNPYAGWAMTSYVGVAGTRVPRGDGVLYYQSRVRFGDITDGLSSTLLVGERPPSARLDLGRWHGGWGQIQNGFATNTLGMVEFTYGWIDGCPPGPYGFAPGQINNQCDAYHFWSLHATGANFLLCDGSVHFIRYSADPLMPALATRAGGEVVGRFD